MDELKKNKLLWVVALLTVCNVGVCVVGRVVVEKAADRVIQKLQKDYSPSPYGPGLDPDKVRLDATPRDAGPAKKTRYEEQPAPAVRPAGWREGWEVSRGFDDLNR